MKKYANIQIFMTGDDSAEVSGDLIKIEYGFTCVTIDWKEEDFKQTHVIPYSQIRMLRITK